MLNLQLSIDSRRRRSGATLILAMIVVCALAICVAATLDYTLQAFRYSQRSNGRAQAIAAGNGALDLAYAQWRAACKSQENIPLTSGTIAGWISAPAYTNISASGTATGFLAGSTPVSITLSALNATDPTMTPLASTATPIPSQAQSASMPSYNYLAKATVNYQVLSGKDPISVSVARVFSKVTSSPWLYGIFFNDDLEINPGAAFFVNGWVQTNGNLYTGGGSSNSNNLTFGNTVNYAGSWNSAGQWDPDDTYHSGTPAPPVGTTPTAGMEQLP